MISGTNNRAKTPQHPARAACSALLPRNKTAVVGALCLGAWLGALPSAAGPPSSDLAATILARIARRDSAQTAFVEVSYRGMLDRPLITSGTMKWLGGDQLERDVDKPYAVVAKIGDGQMSVQRAGHPVQTMPLARAPQIAAILSGFRALLGGDVAQLSQDFALSAVGDHAKWVLTLTPKQAQLQQRVQSIRVDGRGDTPRCMTLREPDGDTTITLLAALAQAGLPGATPQQAAVTALCRND